MPEILTGLALGAIVSLFLWMRSHAFVKQIERMSVIARTRIDAQTKTGPDAWERECKANPSRCMYSRRRH